MNLRTVNLNLLVAFDALLAERNVTRAADRIALSQSAMSNALARLRDLFKDELFVRTAKGMEPTPRALEMDAAVREILRQTSRLMVSGLAFDPATSDHVFNARMSDLIGHLALPSILREIHLAAPQIGLDVVHLSPDGTIDALESGAMDFALSMNLSHGKSICSKTLFTDQMVCIMRTEHRLNRSKKLTMKDFLNSEHIRVSMNPNDARFVDNVLANEGLKRKITVNVPHWLLIVPVLRETDLLAVTSRKMASRFVGRGISIVPLPFDLAPFDWCIYWHRRNSGSEPHQWIRDLVLRACSGL